MSAEFIGILSVGAVLGGLVLALAGLMLTLQSRTDRRLDGFERRLDALVAEFRALGKRVARLEGLIEGSGLFQTPEAPEAAGD